MDLIFKRYASPFCYLDALMEYGSFGSGILNIFDTVQDDKSWELYLSNNPMNNKSFADWKKGMQAKAHNEKPMNKAQVEATVKKSQNILKNFKLPNKQQE